MLHKHICQVQHDFRNFWIKLWTTNVKKKTKTTRKNTTKILGMASMAVCMRKVLQAVQQSLVLSASLQVWKCYATNVLRRRKESLVE